MSNIKPKVGIRPIIDGRRKGIREALEQKTSDMAKAVAEMITNNLRYSDGTPVRCVISDTAIGGVAEAARCAEKFAAEGVGVSISVTSCWCYGAETLDMDPLIPKVVWGFNGTERPGAVYLASALAGYNQKGLPTFGIYGADVQDADDNSIPPDVEKKLLQFARAGIAVAEMRGKSYLSMGNVSMGIAGSMVNPDFFEDYLGMRCEYIDMSEFVRRVEEEIYDKDEYKRALEWTRQYCKEGSDTNKPDRQHSREEKDADWEMSIKMALIAKDLMSGNPKLKDMGFEEEAEGHNAIAAGFQGQRQWTDHFPNGDFMEAILNSSFDWSGVREPYIMATENDSLNGAAMLLGKLLTGTAQIFADVRTYWSPEAVRRVTGYELEGKAKSGIIHLINSGAAALDGTGQQTRNGGPVIKPYWEVTEEEAEKCLEATRWRPAVLEYFRGGGYSSNYLTKGGMPVTMTRINLVKGLGAVMQIVEGYTVDLPQHVHDVLNERTDPTWPTTWFTPVLTGKEPFNTAYAVMNNWGANHGVISYGHIGGDLITIASMLRIPVSMHNVPQDRIFRPGTWNAFGTSDPEGADFRACSNFGPLYGKTKR
ncbi:MAG: L-fucose isomerase [Clostridiaceae bacterium]|nr:L-fucose isomerase [Clostridiaceae bacterium]